jgi:pseudoazurin
MRRFNQTATVLLFAALLGTNSASASAAEIIVNMLNKGAKGGMVFEPDLVKAMPGDTIRFVSVDKGHNVESIDAMLPEGAAQFKSKISDEFVLAPDKEGVYGIKCAPHYGMGMVALVVVGAPVNLETGKAAKHPGKAKERFAAIIAEYETAK